MIGGPQRQGADRDRGVARRRRREGAGAQDQEIPVPVMHEVAINDNVSRIIAHDHRPLDMGRGPAQADALNALDQESLRQLVNHPGNAIDAALRIVRIAVKPGHREARAGGVDRHGVVLARQLIEHEAQVSAFRPSPAFSAQGGRS